jgi:hypothetical protein
MYNPAMREDDLDAAERARRRSEWPVRVFKRGSEPSDDLSATATAAQRLAMMWPLALEAWALTGKPMPDYSRSTMPVRIIRRSS